jgi:mannose-6-phosphate isomerase-like protein (cupin superfamily)
MLVVLRFLRKGNEMQRLRLISRLFTVLGGAALLLCGFCPSSQAQTAAPEPTIQTTPEVLNFSELAERGKALLEKARQGSGSAGITLAHYPGHYTMLTARSASGGAELHKHFADFLFVVDGEGTELTGGTIVDPREQANGEVRGKRLEGATPHLLHKGDVIHIPAGTPHQSIEAPGQTITIYVVKVEVPADSASQNSGR